MKRSSSPLSEKTPEILLVDDNPHGLIARRAVLQELDYRVTTAVSGQEALDLLAKRVFDVVVTDYKMPSMDGIELIKRIRAANPRVRVILLSGYVEPLGLCEQITGADLVIAKSAGEIAHMTRAIRRLLSEPLARKPAASAKPTAKRARA